MSQYSVLSSRVNGVPVYPSLGEFPATAGDGQLAIAGDTNSLYMYDTTSAMWIAIASPGANGDVVGPLTATNNSIVRFDTGTGKLIQNSGVTIDDLNNITTLGTISAADPINPQDVTTQASLPGVLSITSGTFYVRRDGNDATADGSLAKPFLTINAANEAAGAIVGLASDIPWIIDIGPGFYEEAIVPTPYNFVYWNGNWDNTTVIGTVSGDPIVYTAVDAPGDVAGFKVKNLGFVVGFEMTRPPGSVEPSSFRAFDSYFNFGNVTLTGAGLGLDNVEFRNVQTTNVTTTLNTIFATIRNSAFGIMAVSQQGVDGVGLSTTNMHNTQHRRITVNDSALVQLFESRFTNQSITFNGTGGIVNADTISVPVNAMTLNSGALASQLVRTGRTSQIGTLGNTGMLTASNWFGGVAPTDLSDALNKIIDNVVLLNGAPIGAATDIILANAIDTLSVFSSVDSPTTITSYSGIDADQSGRDLTISAGDATQDSGAGVPGNLFLKAGVDSAGASRGTITLDGSIVDIYGPTATTIHNDLNIVGNIARTVSGLSLSISTATNGAGNSGNIELVTGTASGTRGFIDLDGLYIDANSTQIKNVADPTDPQDAATKNYVDGADATKLSTTLASANVFVGNASNVATATAITGDISINNTGVTAIAAGAIVDADINSAAGIARSKLASGTAYRIIANDAAGVMSENAAITANRAVASDANGQLVASATTATELGYVSGVTSAIQTQIDNKGTSTTAAEQDLGTLTWTAGVAPSGTINKKYRWTQVGGLVNLWVKIDASIAGTAVSAVDFALPGDMPSPAIFASQPNSTDVVYGSGSLSTSANGTLSGASSSRIYKDGAAAYQVRIDTTTAIAGAYAWASLSYLA